MEIAIATLLSDRALLLTGIPGTAKTWLSEHLAAAISGDSTLLVQGTSGTSEDALRYGWNYAQLIAKQHSLAEELDRATDSLEKHRMAEEKETDEKLTELAESAINAEAAEAPQAGR